MPPPNRAPLLWLLLPLMAGLATGRVWPPPAAGLGPFLLGAGMAVGLALRAAWSGHTRLGLTALVVGVCVAGFVLFHLRQPDWHHDDPRPPREVTVTLRVQSLFRSAPDARSRSGLGTIVATGRQEAALRDQTVYFSAIRRVSLPPQRSGTYLIRGVIEPLPRDEAGFTDYLANLGVRQRITRAQLIREINPPGWLPRFSATVRTRLEAILEQGLADHPRIASLYLAMLLGEKAALSPEQQDAFMRSGTFHVFCVSGLHVGVIALALSLSLQGLRMPAQLGATLTLVLLWGYVEITGGGTPAVRAYVMVAFVLASRVFRLPGNPLAALTASALVLLLFDPAQLFRTGFQLSYSVVAALLLYGGPLGERWLTHWHPFRFRPRPEWRWWHEGLHGTGRKVLAGAAGCWAAFLGSACAGIGMFGIISPGSILANLIIMPLSFLVIMAGFLSLLTGLAGLLPLSALFNSAAALIILAADSLVRHGTQLPGVYFPAAFRADWLAPAGMAAMTAVLLAGAEVRWAPRRGGFWPPVILLGLLLIFGVKFG